jgi:hypothetical protein
MNDLLFLVADRNMAEAVAGLLDRDQVHRVIGCEPFDFDSRRDIKVAAGQHDPGLYVRANELLRPLAEDYRHAVVIVDEEWEGSPGAQAIEQRLWEHLEDAGWARDRGLALVVCPEADVWLWSDSPHSATALGWPSWTALRPALEREGWLSADQRKPSRPKEAAEWALKHCGHKAPRSAALYRQVASSVSVSRCEDAALERLLEGIRVWFPGEGA